MPKVPEQMKRLPVVFRNRRNIAYSQDIEKYSCGVLTPDKTHSQVRVPHTQGESVR